MPMNNWTLEAFRMWQREFWKEISQKCFRTESNAFPPHSQPITKNNKLENNTKETNNE